MGPVQFQLAGPATTPRRSAGSAAPPVFTSDHFSHDAQSLFVISYLSPVAQPTATMAELEEFVVSNRTTGDGDYCPRGLILPLMDESGWNRTIRAVVYFLALLYAFVGVSVVTDVFMSAVVAVTSKTRKIYLSKSKNNKRNGSYSSVGGEVAGLQEEQPEVVEVRVWNDTVANLTLMALGTSAPEILLAIIEVIGHGFESGELGPNTIVGSAAFNLLIISAICIVSIPGNEVRRIRMLKVFGLSTMFGIFAYIWLFFVVSLWTPNVVELWEAVVTFLLFPVLIASAYAVDVGLCGINRLGRGKNKRQLELGSIRPEENEKNVVEKQMLKDGKIDKDNLVAFVRAVKKYPGLSDEDAALLAASKIADAQPHTRVHYRIGAVRNMTGGRRLAPQLSVKLQEVYDAINEHPDAPNLGAVPTHPPEEHPVLQFHTATIAVRENIGSFQITVCRGGNLEPALKARVTSYDGSAKAHEDYMPIDEIVTFESGEKTKQVTVKIIDDNKWEPDEEFFLKLSILHEEDEEVEPRLGRVSVMEITILDDDNPGMIRFEKRGILVKESAGQAELHVIRRGGSDGEVIVQWRTIDKNAVSGRDYLGGTGEITFGHLEVRQILAIPIIDDLRPERDEHFEVELVSVSGGARIGGINRMAVTITNNDAFNNMVEKMVVLTNTNLDSLAVHRNTWLGQMKDALSVNGGDIANATCSDYVLHLLAFNWKVIFSLIPPPSLWGGWLCFFVSLAAVGAVTALIGDIATIFGCAVGLRDSITAITLVALGTSLPDTFASRTAAIKEQFADNSIGNINGSNSVNVFLGLGLPWMIAAIHHQINGTVFAVPAGSLGFSVLLFTLTAVIAISILMARRFSPALGGGELGGPRTPRVASAALLALLWIFYLVMSILQEYKVIDVQF